MWRHLQQSLDEGGGALVAHILFHLCGAHVGGGSEHTVEG